jgi:ribosomal protein L18
VTLAQEKTENVVLTNGTVTELVKSGISEGIILAKIKNSNTDFDTSSTALVKLKENGVSENVILAMIEAKPKVAEEKKEDNEPKSQKTAEMKEAIGKRKVFLITDDEEARLVVIKKLTEKGFTFVDQKKSAELIVEISYVEANTQSRAGLLKTGNNTEYTAKIGRLTARLNKDFTDYLIYAHEYPFSKAVNTMAIFGVSPAPPSLRDQLKSYLLDDFLKKMKKAGDKFK